MHPSTLKKFNNLVDISERGDYEAHCVDGSLIANVGAFDQTGMIRISLSGVSDIDMYTNCNMLNRYIDLFDEAFDIKTSDNAIMLFNNTLEVLVPMISEEAAKKTSRPLKNPIPYDEVLVFDLPIDAIKTVFKASKIQDNAIIKMEMGDKFIIENGRVKYKKLDSIVGKPFQWHFKFDVIERMVRHAIDKVTITLPYSIQLPAKFNFTVGPISVESYIMMYDPKFTEEA